MKNRGYGLCKVCLLCIVLCFGSCASRESADKPAVLDSLITTDSTVVQPDTIRQEQVQIYKDTLLDNVARFIAALPQEDFSSFTLLEADRYWQEYKASMDTAWNKMYRGRLGKIKEWQASAFSPNINDTLRVFYPFSGPDFLHAYYLYPNAKEYVLAALEPVGDIPPLDTLAATQRDMFLDSLGNSLRDVFKRSYFITKHMKTDLKQVKGVLPPLLFFIERSGHELLDLRFITLDSAGSIIEVEARKLHWQKTPGVHITFRSKEDQAIRQLYYFGISVSNKGIRERPGFVKFIAAKAPFNTFVKSASYLMHESPFTEIKQLILSNSLSLFQDDTGIPYRDFKNQLNLDLQLYGDYTKPVKDFDDSKFQPDLDSAYKAHKNREVLPFSLGYHWNSKKQNYMLAKKQTLVLSK